MAACCDPGAGAMFGFTKDDMAAQISTVRPFMKQHSQFGSGIHKTLNRAGRTRILETPRDFMLTQT